jgi:hypothetical protein
MNRKTIAAAVLITLSALSLPGRLFCDSKADEHKLETLLAQLNASPDDLEINRQIITLVQSKKMRPEMPDEANKLVGQAQATIAAATSPEGFSDAVEPLKHASLLAPWNAKIYYYLGSVQEKAGQDQGAIDSYNLYLFAKPDADNRDKVMVSLGALEARVGKEKKAQAASQEEQRKAATYAEAMKAWHDRQTPGIVVITVGALAATGGLIGWLLTMPPSAPNGSSYTQAQGPQVYQGVAYNKLYDGKYYTTSDYDAFTAAQASSASSQPLYLGIGIAGVVVTVVGIVMVSHAGPAPAQEALLDYKDDKLAWGLPAVEMNPRIGGLQATLLHAQF